MTSRDEELTAEGWVRRSVTENARLNELIELYESLGYKVHLEPVTAEILAAIGEDCGSCFSENWGNFKIIYTREK